MLPQTAAGVALAAAGGGCPPAGQAARPASNPAGNAVPACRLPPSQKPPSYNEWNENEDMISFYLETIHSQLQQAYVGMALALAAGRAFVLPKVGRPRRRERGFNEEGRLCGRVGDGWMDGLLGGLWGPSVAFAAVAAAPLLAPRSACRTPHLRQPTRHPPTHAPPASPQFQCYCEKIWYGVVRCRVVDAQSMPFPVPW